MGQATPTEITNSDVVSMTKAGIGEQTIILAIQRGPVKFDTSPLALISLKGGGVSDQVLNAMLESGERKGQVGSVQQPTNAKANGVAVSPGLTDTDRAAFYGRGCDSGDMDACGNLGLYYRMGWGVSKDLSQATALFKKACDGGSSNGCGHEEDKTSSAPGDSQIRSPNERNPTPVPTDADRATSFKLGCEARDMKACFSLSVYYRMGWGVSKDLSQANALLKKACDGGYADGCHPQETAPTPTSPNKFNAEQAQGRSQGLTLSVLQAQSVPYTQESGGGISTSCNIVGTANTSAYVSAYGNSAYGNARTNSNQQMTCNSYDTTIRWPHVLNVMFVEASDGNSYIIACDRAWAWSKCAPLRAGDTFNARFTNKGIQVDAINTRDKEENPTYQILQSKSLR
jgi:TPR repeat protein